MNAISRRHKFARFAAACALALCIAPTPSRAEQIPEVNPKPAATAAPALPTTTLTIDVRLLSLTERGAKELGFALGSASPPGYGIDTRPRPSFLEGPIQSLDRLAFNRDTQAETRILNRVLDRLLQSHEASLLAETRATTASGHAMTFTLDDGASDSSTNNHSAKVHVMVELLIEPVTQAEGTIRCTLRGTSRLFHASSKQPTVARNGHAVVMLPSFSDTMIFTALQHGDPTLEHLVVVTVKRQCSGVESDQHFPRRYGNVPR